MNNLDAIRGLSGGLPLSPSSAPAKIGATEGASFKDTLQGFLSDVSSMQNRADDAVQRMAAGETTDVHQVMNSVEEAKTSFNMMMELRSKVLDAYKEVMNMQL